MTVLTIVEVKLHGLLEREPSIYPIKKKSDL